MTKKFRKRDNTAFLTEQLLNVTDQEKEHKELDSIYAGDKAEEPATQENKEIHEKMEKDQVNNADIDVLQSNLNETNSFFSDDQQKNMLSSIQKAYAAFNQNNVNNELNNQSADFDIFHTLYESEEDQEEEPEEHEETQHKLKKTFHVRKETKNSRFQLLINEKVLKDIKRIAFNENISTNELINQLIKQCIEEYHEGEWRNEIL